jgi:hypothetical protein
LPKRLGLIVTSGDDLEERALVERVSFGLEGPITHQSAVDDRAGAPMAPDGSSAREPGAATTIAAM